MRIGLELGGHLDLDEVCRADELGLWAVSLTGPAGTEAVRAAQVAQATEHIRIMVRVDLAAEHPLTIAEEISVLDNLSGGRCGVIVDGRPSGPTLRHFCEALVGRVQHGVVIAPAPVQMEIPVWCAEPNEHRPVIAANPADVQIETGRASLGQVTLSGELEPDRLAVDSWRDAGCTHLLVAWPGSLDVLARHLATRAATAQFPEIVARLADQFDPIT